MFSYLFQNEASLCSISNTVGAPIPVQGLPEPIEYLNKLWMDLNNEEG